MELKHTTIEKMFNPKKSREGNSFFMIILIADECIMVSLFKSEANMCNMHYLFQNPLIGKRASLITWGIHI